MITITKQSLIDFINEQPDDRLVDMIQNKSDDTCGCLAVQYMRDRHPDVEFTYAGVYGIDGESGIIAFSDVRFSELVPTDSFNWRGVYGHLKQHLKP